MGERPDELALRRALLEETDPDPGLQERMLAGYRRDPGRRRASWALGAVAVLLAAAIVATLLVVRAERQRQTTPAAPPSSTPSAAPPPLSARAIVAAAFVSPEAGWVVESDRQGPLDAPATVYATTDGGAHWDRQLEVPGNLVMLQADAGGRALLSAQGFAGGSFQTQLYSTSDGGAHWQPVTLPANSVHDPLWSFHMKDAREAWLVRAPVGTPSGPQGLWTGWHTSDAGATWDRLPMLDYAATFGPDAGGSLVFQDATHGVFFCCSQGVGPNRAYVTSDSGAHWQGVPIPRLPAGAGTHLVSLRPLAGGHLVAVLAGPSPSPSPSPPSFSPPKRPAPGPADAARRPGCHRLPAVVQRRAPRLVPGGDRPRQPPQRAAGHD